MEFSERPLASVSKDKSGEGWVVVTSNLAGIPRQERYFASEAEADSFKLSQYKLIRTEAGQ